MNSFLRKIKFWIKLIILSPGIIVHEIAHAFFCLITLTKIYKIVPFRFSEVAGYVKHKSPSNILAAFLISFGPIFVNTFIAFIMFRKFNFQYKDLNSLIILYLGISISLSAIPSDADGSVFGEHIKETIKSNFLFFPFLIFYPLVWILNILNYLKRFKIDYFFTILIFYFALFYYK